MRTDSLKHVETTRGGCGSVSTEDGPDECGGQKDAGKSRLMGQGDVQVLWWSPGLAEGDHHTTAESFDIELPDGAAFEWQ